MGPIPVPTSFSLPTTEESSSSPQRTAGTDAMPAEQSRLDQRLTTTVEERDNVPMPPINKQWMFQLEAALQVFLHQTKRSTISYSTFCSLVPKLSLQAPISTSTDSKTNDFHNLSREDQLWYTVCCVAVPSLYKTAASGMHLENNQTTGQNRLQEMRRLMDQAASKGVSKTSSEKVLKWLASTQSQAKSSKNSQQETPTPAKSASLTASGVILPDMTLEERVRARAKLRDSQMQKAEEIKQNPHEDHVMVSDALFSHACRVLRRRRNQRTAMKGNANRKLQASKCTIPLDDICNVISQYSRKELSSHLQGLAAKCPEWISLTESATKTVGNGSQRSKRTYVTIETTGYKAIRAKLSGDRSLSETSADNQLSSVSGRTPPHQPTSSGPKAVTVSGSKRPPILSSSNTSRLNKALKMRHTF